MIINKKMIQNQIKKIKIDGTPNNSNLGKPDGPIRLGEPSNTTIPKNEDGVNTHSMQNSENNSSNGQKSYLPADLQAKEEAAAAEKAETGDGQFVYIGDAKDGCAMYESGMPDSMSTNDILKEFKDRIASV